MSGNLTRSLPDVEVLQRALVTFLEDAKDWHLCVTGPRFGGDSTNGTERAANLILSNDLGKLNDAEYFYSRIARSRRVVLFATFNDSSSLTIDLRRRDYRQHTHTKELSKRLYDLDNSLLSEMRRRLLISYGTVWLLLLWPLWIAMVLYFIALGTDGDFRAWLSAHQGATTPGPAAPEWMVLGLNIARATWPVATVLAVCIWLILATSGGVGTWPRLLSDKNIASVINRVRAEGLRLENWRNFVVAILSGVVLILIGWILGSR